MHLAYKYRPTTFEQIIGQEHLTAPNAPLRRLIENGDMPHAFFYGPAGCGKTTISRIIAAVLQKPFYELNATTFKIEELRAILKNHANTLQKPLIFIDEVHRLSKTQQEVLLPFMENHAATIIGASTQNPYYSLTSALRSRSFLFELHLLETTQMEKLLETIINNEALKVPKEVKSYIIHSSGGDARAMLNLVDSASKISHHITLESVKSLRPFAMQSGSKEDAFHYDLASALIKSIRGSDIDASIYYLARLIEGGESADFIARRLCILASEDIGNANPNATILASSTLNIVLHVGFPEARIPLSSLVVYLASSPKSNSAYLAINNAQKYLQQNRALDIPPNIKPNAQTYLYPHDFGGWVNQQYLEQKISFYHSDGVGFEKTLLEWHKKITKQS